MITIVDRPVKNHSARPAGAVIDAIIIHDTGALDPWGTFTWFDNPASQASAHYLIDRNGDTYRCVQDSRKAWHAGTSSLWGREDLNRTSIGIELVDVTGDPYPDAQLRALTALTALLCETYRIPLHRVVGHEHVAVPPGRKVDPGKDFEWYDFLLAVAAVAVAETGAVHDANPKERIA